jgi:hypothetical protein
MTPTHRRLRGLGATLAIAGVASLGIAGAPAASAAPAHRTAVPDSAPALAADSSQVSFDAVERRAELLSRLGGPAADVPTGSVPAPGQTPACTMSLPSAAPENVGCIVDPTAPRF